MTINIEIITVEGEGPIILVNNEYMDMAEEGLSELRRKIIRFFKDFPYLLSVRAFGGELMPHQKKALTLEETVSFKRIILNDGEKNTTENKVSDVIYPFLSLLVWHKSGQYFKRKTSRTFECLACGDICQGIEERGSVNFLSPKNCVNENCLSHNIQKILGPGYVFQNPTTKGCCS